MPHTVSPEATASNRLGLNYQQEARALPSLPYPIIDAHAHLSGAEACTIYKDVAAWYGIGHTFSQTHLEDIESVRSVLGNAVSFVAIPNYRAEDKRWHFSDGYLERIEAFAKIGARVAKFWAAPRGRDYALEVGDPDFMRLDAPHRRQAMRLASDYGMVLMAHVADPDTWFQTHYQDVSQYGTKLDQYAPLRRVMEEFDGPWLIAHFGGWPEDLDFLTTLLDRHPNCHIDTSATKWMVRELSKHEPQRLIDFLQRFEGRVLFGSDIVTTDDHLEPPEGEVSEWVAKASSPAQATDLYASRYFALRTLFETELEIPSPIADPDLHLIDPSLSQMDGPLLRGKALPADLLRSIYHDSAAALLVSGDSTKNVS